MRFQGKPPSPLIYPSNKIIPTKCNIHLGTTYRVIEDVIDYAEIKRKLYNENSSLK